MCALDWRWMPAIEDGEKLGEGVAESLGDAVREPSYLTVPAAAFRLSLPPAAVLGSYTTSSITKLLCSVT